MLLKQVSTFQSESGPLGQQLDVLHGRELAAGKDLGADEPHELQVTDGELDSVVVEELLRMRQDGVQQHPAIAGQDLVGAFEEQRVALRLERLERADADDAIDRLIELLPALQTHLDRTFGIQFREPFPGELRLSFAQRDADDVDVVFLDSHLHRSAPAAADVKQGHSGFEVKFAQREVEFRHLGLVEGHVVALEIGTGVSHGGAQEQGKEVIRDVVDGLRLVVVGSQVRFDVSHQHLPFESLNSSTHMILIGIEASARFLAQPTGFDHPQQ